MTVERRTAVTTADTDEAVSAFADAFPGLAVSARAADPPFAFAYTDLVTERFTLHRMSCAGLLRASGPLPESIAIGRRSTGEVVIRRDGRTIDTSRPYLRPTAPSEFGVRDARVMLITLRPEDFTAYLRRSGERPSVRSAVAAKARLAAWGLVMDHAATFLDEGTMLTTRTEEDELFDLLCSSLLHAVADPWSELRSTDAGPNALRRAVQYLEEHAHEAVRMPDVAGAARTSVRTVHLLFRREFGTTPIRWLRDLRLDRARVELLTGGGGVAEVAARNGMPHAGRFAADYRDRFGERPSDTLRRAG